ncbi:hypothetical protein CPB84DRAFT_1853311 [Gymnopilus junonius]|uniref:Uncharacterized protein n=1 Tax=Gymnopilus junonius TaxID=109634 RepID=A0A9P5TFP2_GYMJU|nr:hypothetical protein CPB84DRAFT_1853311 [Gymnopilus junonius]
MHFSITILTVNQTLDGSHIGITTGGDKVAHRILDGFRRQYQLAHGYIPKASPGRHYSYSRHLADSETVVVEFNFMGTTVTGPRLFKRFVSSLWYHAFRKPAVLALTEQEWTAIMWTAAAFVGKKKKQATAEAVADSSSASGPALRVSEEEKRHVRRNYLIKVQNVFQK